MPASPPFSLLLFPEAAYSTSQLPREDVREQREGPGNHRTLSGEEELVGSFGPILWGSLTASIDLGFTLLCNFTPQTLHLPQEKAGKIIRVDFA